MRQASSLTKDNIIEKQINEQLEKCDIISLIFNLFMAFCHILHAKQMKIVPKGIVEPHILVIVHEVVSLQSCLF